VRAARPGARAAGAGSEAGGSAWGRRDERARSGPAVLKFFTKNFEIGQIKVALVQTGLVDFVYN
jgi:hypothetical protein